ncbi:MAG: hypothetical protein WCT14_05940 [Treponemataceae bacterium]
MTIQKKALVEMNRCYAVNSTVIDGQTHVLFATEGEGPCFAFTGKDFQTRKTVWEGPGGTMSIVPIPGTNGEFLAVQKFFKLFQWDEAIVVWVKPRKDGSFAFRQILHLPYIHRFDLLTVGDRHYFLGCTLAESKETRDDWSKPGKIYVGELPSDWDQPLRLSVLRDGLFKNHGYSRLTQNGVARGLVSSEEGAFIVTPPQSSSGDWSIEQIMDWPISEIDAIDIDGDGELEFATIEPWHGSYFRVYKKIDGKYVRIFEHPEVSEFYHVVVGAKLRGKPVFIGGCRRGKQQLFYVHAASTAPLSLAAVEIEAGVGPSNVAVVNEKDRDVIVSANREKAEAALYFVTD